jgi:hypothetical protein
MEAADFEALPEEDKHRMSTMIDHLQVRDRSSLLLSSPPLPSLLRSRLKGCVRVLAPQCRFGSVDCEAFVLFFRSGKKVVR